MNLRRCIRFYPHQNNTGGFFIAVIKKLQNTDTLTEKIKTVPLNYGLKKTSTIGEDLEQFMNIIGYKDDGNLNKTQEIQLIKEVEKDDDKNIKSDDLNLNSYVNFQDYDENFLNVIDINLLSASRILLYYQKQLGLKESLYIKVWIFKNLFL